MDSQALAIFVETISAGSLAGAARRLRVDPLVASRRLAALEKQLGVRLIQRTTRALSLTPEGEVFLPYAQSVLEAELAAMESVSQHAGRAEGLLRVTSSAAFGRTVIIPFAARFMQQHPVLQLDMLMTDRVVDLVGEGIDLAIRLGTLTDSDLVARHLGDTARLLVAAPDYVARHGVPQSLDDLANHECLSITGQTHWRLRKAGAEVARRVAGRFSANSAEGVAQACRSGLGIAMLASWFVHDAVCAGDLIHIKLKDAEMDPLSISAVYPSRRLLPNKVRLFVEALSAELTGTAFKAMA